MVIRVLPILVCYSARPFTRNRLGRLRKSSPSQRPKVFYSIFRPALNVAMIVIPGGGVWICLSVGVMGGSLNLAGLASDSLAGWSVGGIDYSKFCSIVAIGGLGSCVSQRRSPLSRSRAQSSRRSCRHPKFAHGSETDCTRRCVQLNYGQLRFERCSEVGGQLYAPRSNGFEDSQGRGWRSATADRAQSM